MKKAVKIFIDHEFGVNPQPRASLCDIMLNGYWAVETQDFPEKEEYSITFKTIGGPTLEIAFPSKLERDKAAGIVKSDQPVENADNSLVAHRIAEKKKATPIVKKISAAVIGIAAVGIIANLLAKKRSK